MKIIRVECFHCGLPIAPEVVRETVLDGVARSFCCAGCEAAARTIVALGLGAYYRQRQEPAGKPEEASLAGLHAYDDASFLGDVLVREPEGRVRARLILDGVACAACAWLIEQRLRQLPGMAEVIVDYAQRQATVCWDLQRLSFAELLRSVWRLGYRAWPFEPQRAGIVRQDARAALLRRLGVASLCGMQVMMVASALWFDASASGVGEYLGLLNTVNFAATLPIVGYAAIPFYQGALRDLRNRSASMDLSVTLGIGLAFLGSTWHLLKGGEVYFDSIAMFVTLLLAARYLEAGSRLRASSLLDRLHALRVTLVSRLVGGASGRQLEKVPAYRLALGDCLYVLPGEAIVVDGVVRSGNSNVDESILTGESRPVPKSPGATVIAGSANLDSPLEVTVTALHDASFLARIAALVEQAAAARPPVAQSINRLALWFSCGTLVVAAASIALHVFWFRDAWLPSAIAVLVISCPCALALATPVALTAASNGLLARGVAVIRGDALEKMSKVTRVVFDKTGTLTKGRPSVVAVEAAAEMECGVALALAGRLAQGSEHPLARALLEAQEGPPGAPGDALYSEPGRGLRGVVDGAPCLLGSSTFLAAEGVSLPTLPDHDRQETWLSRSGKFVARFQFDDALREDARALVDSLRAQGLDIAIFSGDRQAAVMRVAQSLGISEAQGELLPQGKLQALMTRQAAGEVVMVVGDGVNDAPMFARADVAVAVAGATAQAKLAADLVLLRDELAAVGCARRMAQATHKILHQNIGWALGYNVVALPLAIVGWVAPWIAALCMSASSLMVTLNALRLRRVR